MPCAMDQHKCELQYYDKDLVWQVDDCIGDFMNAEAWYSISGAPVWANTTKSVQLPWIWSYWEDQYHQQNFDWEMLDHLDW